MRSSGGTKSAPPSVVTASTNSTIACFADTSFHDGSGSSAAWALQAATPSATAATQATRLICCAIMTISLIYERGSAPLRERRLATCASRRQLPTLELLPRRTEITEMVNRRSRRRELECLKLLLEHLVQVVLRGDPDSDMWVELLAAVVWHIVRNVVDRRLVDLG